MYQDKYIFSQLTEFLPRHELDKCVDRYNGNKLTKKLSCRDQFIAKQLKVKQNLYEILQILQVSQFEKIALFTLINDAKLQISKNIPKDYLNLQLF